MNIHPLVRMIREILSPDEIRLLIGELRLGLPDNPQENMNHIRLLIGKLNALDAKQVALVANGRANYLDPPIESGLLLGDTTWISSLDMAHIREMETLVTKRKNQLVAEELHTYPEPAIGELCILFEEGLIPAIREYRARCFTNGTDPGLFGSKKKLEGYFNAYRDSAREPIPTLPRSDYNWWKKASPHALDAFAARNGLSDEEAAWCAEYHWGTDPLD